MKQKSSNVNKKPVITITKRIRLRKCEYCSLSLKLCRDLLENPEACIQSFNPTELELLNQLIGLVSLSKKNYIHPSQENYLSRRLGVSREHVNKMIRRLCIWGVISKRYIHGSTCQYKLSSFFVMDWVKRLLVPYLPNISRLSGATAICYNVTKAAPTHAIQQEFTHIRYYTEVTVERYNIFEPELSAYEIIEKSFLNWT